MPDTVMTAPVASAYENRSATITELAKALSKAQGVMGGATKDAENPHFKNMYADLASVWNAIRQPLSDNGLAVVQFPRTAGDGVEIETTILHVSGEFMRDVLWVPCSKRDAQGIGSAITYGRRYALMAVVGIAPVDDDGNDAVKTTPKNATPPTPRNSTPPAPRNSSANGRAMANDEPHLIDHTREKGTIKKPPVPEDPELFERRKKAVLTFMSDTLEAIREGELDLAALDELITEPEKKKRLAWAEQNVPEDYEHFMNCHDAAKRRALMRQAGEEAA